MGHFKENKMSGEERRQRIVVYLAVQNLTTNMIAHSVWPDWIGPRGQGSHPLCRPTGKILSLMKKEGLVDEVYNDLRKRYEWKLIKK